MLTNWAVKTFSCFYFCDSWIIRENRKSLHHVKISLYTVYLSHAFEF